MTWPPASPAPGPISMTQSLAATTRISCSTTTTVLPASISPSSCANKLVDVERVQPCGWLIEHVEGVAALHALQLGDQFDALRLATGKFGSGLAQSQIAESDLRSPTSDRNTAGASAKNAQAASTVSASTSAMFLSRYRIVQRLRIVARAMTGRARRIHAGQEQQFDTDETLAFAGWAAALGDVKRETTGVIAARARLPGRGKQVAHGVEQTGVGRKVGARRASDGLLVDAYQPRIPCMPPLIRPLQMLSSVLSSGSSSLSETAGSRPNSAATSSARAWLTRLDLPEPDTPVTVVNTPSGKATSIPAGYCV